MIDIDEFVDSLRQQNGIDSGEAFAYADEHYDEIQTLDRIFKLETQEHIRQCMALARILTPEWADAIIAYSRREKFNKAGLTWVAEPDASQYSLAFISAFYYAPRFLKEAWDWCVCTYQEAKEYNETGVSTNVPNIGGFDYIEMLEAATTDENDDFTKGSGIITDFDCSGKVDCIDRRNGNIEFRVYFDDPTAHEKIADDKLELSVFTKEGAPIKEHIPLKPHELNEFACPGDALVYTTEEIPDIYGGKLKIGRIANNV